MNRWRIFVTPVVFIWVLVLVLGPAALAQENPGAMKLIVRDLSGRTDDGALYLASSANNWNPSDAEARLELRPSTAEDDAPEWSIDLPIGAPDAAGFEFKITRGSWDTVEVDARGGELPNRVVPAEILDSGRYVYRITVEGFADQRPDRWPELVDSGNSTVNGNLDIFEFTSTVRDNTRHVRVWLPPGYDSLELADERYPVLYMHDGQNLFDNATSHQGVEWGMDETLSELITSGAIPPMIVVGIDSAGEDRGNEYLPVAAGPEHPGLGGKADEYLRMFADELMPLINHRYRTLTGSEHTSMGGSSYGGIITLTAAIGLPNMFGAILVESPSLWVGDGEFMEMVKAHDEWPNSLYLAMGTAETEQADDTNDRFVALAREAGASLRASGLGESQLRVVIEEGAKHNEEAWARRLPAALRFLFAER